MAERFGEFVLLSRLGTGRITEVFLAQTSGAGGFERRFALKRLLPRFAADSTFIEKLAQEARLMSALHHPCIVSVHDFSCTQGQYYILMEPVDGFDLKTLIFLDATRCIPLPVATAIHVSLCVLDALAHAAGLSRRGARRIVHRDVCPHNVLISSHGDVKLADFGLSAVAADADERHDWVQPGYRAPEGAIDERSDVYAAGVLLHQLLTGRHPLGQGGQPLPAPLVEPCAHAIEPRPAARYQSAAELAAALRDVRPPPAPGEPEPASLLARLVEERRRWAPEREPSWRDTVEHATLTRSSEHAIQRDGPGLAAGSTLEQAGVRDTIVTATDCLRDTIISGPPEITLPGAAAPDTHDTARMEALHLSPGDTVETTVPPREPRGPGDGHQAPRALADAPVPAETASPGAPALSEAAEVVRPTSTSEVATRSRGRRRMVLALVFVVCIATGLLATLVVAALAR